VEDELLGFALMSTITKIMIEPESTKYMYCPKPRPRNWKSLIDHIELAIENHSAALSLKANNKAYFYQKRDFEVIEGVDIEIGQLSDGGLRDGKKLVVHRS
jgi:hypothetical protein